MIYIVHGDDYSKSRHLIINQQKKLETKFKTEVEITEISPGQLLEMGISYDIFGNAPFLVIKIPDTKVPDAEKYIDALMKIPEKTVVIVLAGKELSSTHEFMKSAPVLRAKIVLNGKPAQSNVFDFVDQLFSKSRIKTYQELKKLEADRADPFYLFSMVLYGLRNVTHAKFNTAEFQKKSPFVKNKALKQSEGFSKEDLFHLYESIYKIDKDLKTGMAAIDTAIIRSIEKILS